MHRFGLGLGIAGWLCCSFQSLSPALAETSPCTVTASAPSALMPSSWTSFGAMPKTLLSDSSSYFQVSCSGSGSLKLSIPSSNTYNGTPLFRVSSADGIFTSSNTDYSNGFTIPFSTSASNQSGKVYYQIQVAAPDGQVLRSKTDYTVTIKADLILNN